MIVKVLTVTVLLLQATTTSCKVQNQEKQFHKAVEYWTEALCTLQKTKTFVFHGIFLNSTKTLENFFDVLLQTTSDYCSAIVLLKIYSNKPNFRQDASSNVVNSNTRRNNVVTRRYTRTEECNVVEKRTIRSLMSVSNVLHQKWNVGGDWRRKDERYIDMWTVNVIFLGDSDSFEKLLNSGTLFEWNSREHFIVLAVWNDLLEELNDRRPMIDRTLRKLWLEHHIQNVLFDEPLSRRHDSTLYMYDPFAVTGEGTWGQLESVDGTSKRQILRLLSLLTYQRTINFNGYLFNVSIFDQDQEGMKIRGKIDPRSIFASSGGYNGPSGILLGELVRKLNFTINVIEPNTTEMYGHQMENGTFSGAVGDVAYRRVVASFASFFVKRYVDDMSSIEFTTTVGFDQVCVIVPKAGKIPKGLRMFYIFESSVWLYILLSYILVYFTWYYVQLFSPTGLINPFAFNIFDEISRELSHTLGEISRQLSKSLDETSREQNNSLDEISRELSKSLDEISRQLSLTLDEISRQLSHTLDEISRQLSLTLDEISRQRSHTLGEISRELSNTLDEISRELSQSLDEISRELSLTLDEISRQLSHTLREISRELSKSLDETSREQSNSLDEISRGPSHTFDEISRDSKSKSNRQTTAFHVFFVCTGYPVTLPLTTSKRCLLLGILFSSITIVGIFNGILYKSFAKDMFYKDINNLAELDASGLPVGFLSYSTVDIFGTRNEPNLSRVSKSLQTKLIHLQRPIEMVAFHRNISGLLREQYFSLMHESLIDATGTHMLHLVTECPARFYLACLIPSNSFLRERLNIVIGRLNQAGLPTLWQKTTIQEKALKMKLNIQKDRKHEKQIFVAFQLCDLQICLFILATGLFSSTVVFFHEKEPNLFSRTSYESYDLERGPVFYEAYYPDSNEDSRSNYQEKFYFDRGTVLEKTYQLPSERLPYQENNVQLDNYQTRPDNYLQNDDRFTLETNTQPLDIKEISKIARRAISRDLENWNTIENYLDRAKYQDPVYRRRVVVPEQGYRLEQPIHGRDSVGGFRPIRYENQLPREQEVVQAVRTNEMNVASLKDTNPANSRSILDPYPTENIFAPRPQVINYIFSRKPEVTTENKVQSVSEAKETSETIPRNYGDNLIQDEIKKSEEDKDVKVTSIEVSEVPRHKTRHHHGEWPKRDYSRRHQS
ncbi:hypothetical protein WH47_00318 [Habropoda laboriosa]|uniref:Glutamate receptor delta-2 subunit n=1 Tax=Habropoda laboriosa TaxID=597456 RepID=A0A0L7R1S3_9HYME|nr:hypothetical protein WH47_00318 [Habropoda laboriosa]